MSKPTLTTFVETLEAGHYEPDFLNPELFEEDEDFEQLKEKACFESDCFTESNSGFSAFGDA